MTRFRSAAFPGIGALSLILVLMAAPAWAQEEGYERTGAVKDGGIIAVSFAPTFTFDGDTFDGQTIYKEIDGEELMALPKLDKHQSFRAILGFRHGPGALEIGYERNKFNGSLFDEFPMEATFQAVNFDGRVFLFQRSRVQPHFLAGMSLPFLSIKDGNALNEAADKIGNAKFSGYGLNTEAGVTIFPLRSVGIGIGYSYRFFWFDRADSGVSDKQFELRPRFRETSGTVVFNISVII